MLFLMIAALEEDDRDFMLNLYREYYALARSTVYRVVLRADELEDLTEDVFLKLIEKTSVLRTLDCCRTATYVVYTAKSVAINFIRHRDVRQKYGYYGGDADVSDELPGPDASPEDACLRHESLKSLSDAVLKLPERQKNLLYFKYVLEMSNAEIAEELSVRPESVREYLTRARRAARKLMEQEESQNGGAEEERPGKTRRSV